MKKLLVAAAIFSASISFTYAQQGQGGGGRGFQMSPTERVNQLAERLKLTADQKTKIEAIFTAQNKSIDSLRNSAGEGADRQALREKFAPIREATDKKVTAILTADQQKEYAKVQEEMRSRMGQGGRGRGGQGGGGN